MTPSESSTIEKLGALNRIAESLNQAVDVRGVLDRALADLVELMELDTAWISLIEHSGNGRSENGSWVLAARHNLPPALDPDGAHAWQGSCRCRELSNAGKLTAAYNEVHCSRLEQATGEKRDLSVHASAPLRVGDRDLGILNVAASDWSAFTPEALSLLSNVGSQMGIALERAQLFDLLKERHVLQQAEFLRFSEQLLARLDLDDVIGYLVEGARKILYADACAILLPSEEPGFLEFQASAGWRVNPTGERRRVPLDENSGPGVAMQTQQPVVAEDIQKSDPTAWAPDWVQEEGFHGHAVMPLVANGQSVGVVVINRRQPYRMDDDDLYCLRLMANQAAIAIESARLHEEAVKMHALEKELEVGRQIQLSMLPTRPPKVPGWEFASFYQPAREVGGDFYDFFELPGTGSQLGLVIGDVTGKGVPAALFMARASTQIRSEALRICYPGPTLTKANAEILKDRRTESLLTALYAMLDTDTGWLTFANAGHCRPLLLQAASGEIQELEAGGILLGAFAEIDLEERLVELAPGDTLVLYSDGASEAMNASHSQWGTQRLRDTLLAHAGCPAEQIAKAIVDAVGRFRGNMEQSDDLTLLVIRRAPAE